MKISQIMYNVLKYFFGILLITTGIGKLLDNRGFAEIILTYQFGLPHSLAMVLGLSVSLFELFVGIFILQEKKQMRNAALIILMHSGYVFLAVISNLRGLNLTNCGCFGVFLGRPMTWATVVEDIVLVGLSILFYALTKKKLKPIN